MSKSPLLSQLRHHILCLASASDLRLAWHKRHLVAPANTCVACDWAFSAFLCWRVSGMFPCVAGAAFCGSGHPLVSPVPARAGMRPWFFLAWQAAGNHLCRRRPHVLVCGRNASLHARRSIMSTSTCLYHIFSFLTWLYQSVFINMSNSTCLNETVYINLSKWNCLYHKSFFNMP